jgi:phenylpropionate dioxygenase-like ring-hydroxylating dioxygenase large terminal subunit
MQTDAKPVPDFLLDDSCEYYMGSSPLPVSRYTDPESFRLEKERMWPRVWQFAARDEEMPVPGDYVVYENAGRSYLVTRQEDGGVRAFHNVCLHRGRKLRSEDGATQEFRCPYHGMTWHTDGSIKHIPCRWDFPHLRDQEMRLPEAKTARWGGYIFVREDSEGPTIEEYLHPLPRFFERWPHDNCYTAVWVGKVIHANWKICVEGFSEAFHAPEIHPQIMPFIGDTNGWYGTWGDHVNLNITASGIPSPELSEGTAKSMSEQAILEEFNKYNGLRLPGGGLPPGKTARQHLAEVARDGYKDIASDIDSLSDLELLDSFDFKVFPNFSPWGGMQTNIVYRFRPWPDQKTTLMEVRYLMRARKGEKTPLCAPMRLLGENEPWAAEPGLGSLGDIFDQDTAQLEGVQQGVEVSKTGVVNLANYQEIRIRHFSRTLQKYLSRS